MPYCGEDESDERGDRADECDGRADCINDPDQETHGAEEPSLTEKFVHLSCLPGPDGSSRDVPPSVSDPLEPAVNAFEVALNSRLTAALK